MAVAIGVEVPRQLGGSFIHHPVAVVVPSVAQFWRIGVRVGIPVLAIEGEFGGACDVAAGPHRRARVAITISVFVQIARLPIRLRGQKIHGPRALLRRHLQSRCDSLLPPRLEPNRIRSRPHKRPTGSAEVGPLHVFHGKDDREIPAWLKGDVHAPFVHFAFLAWRHLHVLDLHKSRLEHPQALLDGRHGYQTLFRKNFVGPRTVKPCRVCLRIRIEEPALHQCRRAWPMVTEHA